MRKFDLYLCTFFAVLLAVSCTAQESGADEMDLEAVVITTGLGQPTSITHAGDERIFVVLQPGTIEILYRDGTKEAVPFLDIQDRVRDQGSEQGLLGLAFPPDYCTSGYFYVNYTYREGSQDYTRVSRFAVNPENPDLGDADSEDVLLQFAQPYSNHNGGHLEFGPDGMLYIATGDGGAGGDPQNNAQNLLKYLGKLLRIDVSVAPGYTIPDDNPFAFIDNSHDEIWDFGLRNPWKFAFDAENGDLYIADVGQNAWEEINFEPADSEGGVNYGWRCYEGTHEYDLSECETTDFEMPIFEYPHTGGRCSVTGGRVYRGPSYQNMIGRYFFTDLCSGEFWSIHREANEWISEDYGGLGASSVTTFGTDVWGELYFATSVGKVYRLADATGELVDPIMFENGNTLSSSLEGVEYQWLFNGTPLDDNAQSINIDENGVYSLIITTAAGCEVDAGQIEITNVGTDNREGGKSFQLYPNPGGGQPVFRAAPEVVFSSFASLDFYSTSGKRIRSIPVGPGENAIALSDIPAGFYIVKLMDGSRLVGVSKFVKQ